MQLGTQPPFRLELIISGYCFEPFRVERFFHERFKNYRLNGEWFSLDEDGVKYICEYLGMANFHYDEVASVYRSALEEISSPGNAGSSENWIPESLEIPQQWS